MTTSEPEVLKLEETSFRRTLERGLRLLEEETATLAKGAPLAGEVAFRLYDTYGFPLDLTQDALRGQGRTVDTAGFDAAMARQREAARATWKGSGESAVDPVWFDLRESLGATEFLGYATTHAEGVVQALVELASDPLQVGQCIPAAALHVVRVELERALELLSRSGAIGGEGEDRERK